MKLVRAIKESIDLHPAEANRKRLLATPRAMATLGAVLIFLIDAAVLITRRFSDVPPLLLVQLAVSYSLITILVWAAFISWAPGPVKLDITSDGIQFGFESGKRLTFRWDDPSLNLSIWDYTGIPWGKGRVPQPVPMYLSGVGVGKWRSIALTAEAGAAILREAQERSLSSCGGANSGPTAAGSSRNYQTRIRAHGITPLPNQNP